ncbi:TetR/AcrR family transcriptional regulator [Nocardia sp. BMG111209]|uniref:TetR/AcrR family transcriptional regulator n=1 Tax=Nocardia sp. BMG111209 TaxID=1160137 RepID=UPI00035C69E2|nr:TetR/AcrR family transcriptional regulator [Nocardia sp. BMG111209]
MTASDPNPSPRRTDARRNRLALIAAAAEVFAAQGANAALDTIARAAGVGNATMYRHFPTRDAMIEAVLAERYRELATHAEELAHAEAADTALFTWLAEFVAYIQTFRGLSELVLATLRDHDSALYASCKAMRTSAAELLTRAQRTGAVRADIDASDLFTHAAGIAWAAQHTPTGDPDRTARLLGVLADGLRHPESRSPQPHSTFVP